MLNLNNETSYSSYSINCNYMLNFNYTNCQVLLNFFVFLLNGNCNLVDSIVNKSYIKSNYFNNLTWKKTV